MIIEMLHSPEIILSCQQITSRIIKKEKIPKDSSVARYLSGSVSSILCKMVKDGDLAYDEKLSPRGGHMYRVFIFPNDL